ncbi:hypothetical protein AAFF_G00305770 [Aldrovandia affinis]|uniref:Uncharacterized protein n=1 Tax=Aldrovandia affinis TaxID=143900 RepID=A0AAD7WR47_9TELE|nr:hypothetical protein AAFF_G00305770 [Aldrovandia affinis]
MTLGVGAPSTAPGLPSVHVCQQTIIKNIRKEPATREQRQLCMLGPGVRALAMPRPTRRGGAGICPSRMQAVPGPPTVHGIERGNSAGDAKARPRPRCSLYAGVDPDKAGRTENITYLQRGLLAIVCSPACPPVIQTCP